MEGDRNQYSTAQPGQNIKLIRHLRKIACPGPRLNLNKDPEEVRQRVAACFTGYDEVLTKQADGFGI